MPTFGLYVHIPFCPQHCPYCAFTVLTGHTNLYDRYVEAVCTELRQWHPLAGRGPLDTVFIGGGTPSLLEPIHIGKILETADTVLGLAGVRLSRSERHMLQGSPKFQAMLDDALLHLQELQLCLTPHGFPLADSIGIAIVELLENPASPIQASQFHPK